MAYESGAEVETQLDIAKELDYVNDETYQGLTNQIEEILKMINVVMNKL